MAELTFYTSKYQGEEVDRVVEQIQAVTFESTNDIIIPMAKGGTGSDDGATGLSNLFGAGPTILSAFQYGPNLPIPSEEGQLFFQQANDLATFNETAKLLYPINSIFFTTETLTDGPDLGTSALFTWEDLGSFSIGDIAIHAWRRIA